MAQKVRRKKESTLLKVLKAPVTIPVRRIQRPIQNQVKEKNDEIGQLKAQMAQVQNETRQEAQERIDRVKQALSAKRLEVERKDTELTAMTDYVRRLSSVLTSVDPKYHLRIPPFYKDLTYGGMYRAVELSPEVSAMHRKLEEEVLRRGNRWEPAYTSKCPKCKSEWHGEEPLDRCPECDPLPDDFLDKVLEMIEAGMGSGEVPDRTIERLLGSMGDTEDTVTPMIVPNEKDHALADKFFEEMNPTGQTLDDLDKVLEADINTSDACFYMLRWKYKNIDEMGVAGSKELLSIYQGKPTLVRKVIDGFDNMGGIWWKCIVHSDQIQEELRYDHKGRPRADFEHPTCPICARPMHEVLWVQLAFEATTPEQVQYTSYFIDGEVIEGHYYGPNEAFGKPPMIPLYIPTATLIHIHVYVYDTYKDRRLPLAVAWSVSANPEEAVRRWDSMQEKLATDPTYIPHYVMEPEMMGGSSGKMGITQFMPTLHEMDYVEYMDKLVQRIGNYYGIFYNKFAKSSNNPGASEGPDMQVDPKTLEMKHRFWNKMHDKLTAAIGTGPWYYHKVPAEDRDVMRKLQIKQLEWQIAQQASTVGFETIRNAVGDLVQRKPPLDEEDISRLMEIVKAMIYLKGSIHEQEMLKEQQNQVTFSPQDRTPQGTKTKQDRLAKGLEVANPSSVVEGEKFEADPSEKQKKTGRYRKPTTTFNGESIAIENPVGSTRSGVDRNGNEWTSTLKADYGHILGTKGADGDAMDVFIKPASKEGGPVFLISQVDPSTGKFDEYKVMFGYDSEEDAKAGYLANYQDGWQGLGSIGEMTQEGWLYWAYDHRDSTQVSKGDPRGEGESRPKSTSPQKTSTAVRTQEASSKPNTLATNPPGTQDVQTDSKGRTWDSKQQAGGASRGRDQQPQGDPSTQLLNLERLLVALILLMRTKQAPRRAVDQGRATEAR